MFAAIASLFAAFTTLFGAANKAAGAVDNLCGWAEESSGAFADEARCKRAAALLEMTSAKPKAKPALADTSKAA